ncbi:hypothetical protein B566_EDAN015887 [Ephemera danica]|nr:hypothetical protein B566_EDAN015887 [Ephemera danica]
MNFLRGHHFVIICVLSVLRSSSIIMGSVKNISYALFRGLVDSIRGCTALLYLDRNIKERALQTPVRNRPSKHDTKDKKQEEPKVLERVLQCCALNGGVFWLSILVFEYVLLPVVRFVLQILGTDKFVWSWIQPLLSWTFGAVWVLPLFLLSKAINSLWFQDIADSAYRYSRGRPLMMSSFSKLIADMLFSILVQALFLVQSMLVSMLPIAPLGLLLYQVHMCLLYSLYAFEYKWFNMGWELHRRLTYIENNWPYFVGFGLPLAIFTSLPSSYIISGCVFSILFPLFIISGNEAEPVTDSCDFPLHLFMPVIAVSNILFNRTIGSSAAQPQSTAAAKSKKL